MLEARSVTTAAFEPGVPDRAGVIMDPRDGPVWSIPATVTARAARDPLYDTLCDPGQVDDRWDDDPATRDALLDGLRQWMDRYRAPSEQVERLRVR